MILFVFDAAHDAAFCALESDGTFTVHLFLDVDIYILMSSFRAISIPFVSNVAHDAAICAMESDENRMVSSDDVGNIIVWQAGDRFKQLLHIKGDG